MHEKVIVLEQSVIFLFHNEAYNYMKYTLFVFSGLNPIRRACVWLNEWKYFKRFIILIIFLNTLTLILYDYTDRDSLTTNNYVIDLAGDIFTYIFTLEAIVDIIARGFIFHKNAYLRSGWGLLDFIVVIGG